MLTNLQNVLRYLYYWYKHENIKSYTEISNTNDVCTVHSQDSMFLFVFHTEMNLKTQKNTIHHFIFPSLEYYLGHLIRFIIQNGLETNIYINVRTLYTNRTNPLTNTNLYTRSNSY